MIYFSKNAVGKDYIRRLLEIYDINVVSTVIGVIIASFVFVYIYYPYSNHQLLLLWSAAQLLVSFSRLFTRKLYIKSKSINDRQYIHYIYINQILTSVCWFVIPFIFVDFNNIEVLLITYFSFAAFASVATTSMTGFPVIGSIYITLTLLPLIITNIMQGNDYKYELTFVTSVYLIYQIMTLVRNSRSTRKYILKAIDLFNSESLVRNIVDVSVDAIVSLDVDGKIIDWNNSATQLLGWNKNNVLGIPVSNIIRLKGNADFFKDLPSISTLNNPERRILSSVKNKSGKDIILDIVIREAFFSNSSYFILYLHDQTDSIKYQRELKRTDERIRNLLDSVDTGIIEVEFDGRISFINQTALRILGYSRKELLGQNFTETIQYKEHLDQATSWEESLIFKRLEIDLDLHLYEQLLWDKNGNIVNVQLSSVPVTDSNNNRIAIISFTDITKTYNILQEQKRLMQISEASPDLMLMFTLEGKILSINKSARDIFGLSSLHTYLNISLEDLISNQNLYDLITSEAIPVANKNNFWAGETLYTTLYGDDIYFSVYLMTLQSDSNIEYYSLVLTDITERVIAQQSLISARNEALQAAKAKSDFLAAMSHEIRTPMNGVLGMAQLLKETKLDDEQTEYLSIISSSGNALLTIINDILDLSKIEAGHLLIESLDFDLERSIHELCILLIPKANEKDIELILNFSAECPRLVNGDAGRLRQILMNLIGNSLKFTHQGHIIVEVKPVSEIVNGSVFLQFSVKDSGIGIAKDKQQTLFESFTQADSSTTRQYGGTGLGLSICKQLVEAMGGSIQIESELGKGSNFYFSLEFPVVESRHYLQHKSLLSKKVLIVDDSYTNLKILKNQLTHFGMKISTAQNYPQVMNLLKNSDVEDTKFDLIILDYLMPEVNGLELGKMIKNDPDITDCPLVICSSSANKGEAKFFEENGFSGYLSKPILLDILHDTLECVLGEYKNPSSKSREIITRYDVIDSASDEILNINFNGARVLLAEDNPVNQKVATSILTKHNLQVTIAEDGQKAIDIFKQDKFDIILMDCQMPVKDGFEATLEINNYQKENNISVPVIALTANVMESEKNKCLNSGMKGFIPKPFSSEILLSTIQDLLKNKEVDVLKSNVNEQTDTDLASLDINTLNSLKVIMEDDFAELVSSFYESSEQILSDLKYVQQNQQFDILQRNAHSLKSSSANLGAFNLSSKAKALEAQAKNKINIEVKQLDSLEKEYSVVKELLMDFCAE